MINNWFVYIFLNPFKEGTYKYNELTFNYEPFYIGISTNKYRDKVHFQPEYLKNGSIKSRLINKIVREGGDVIVEKVKINLSQEEATNFEIEFIKFFGKIKDKTGILSNITDGGEGNKGLKHSERFLNSLRIPIYKFDLELNLVEKYTSINEAYDKNKNSVGLGQIKNHSKTNSEYKGFIWSRKFELTTKEIPINSRCYRFKYQIYKDNILIKEFLNMEQIETFFGKRVSRGNISVCCNDKSKRYLGYQWAKESKNQNLIQF